MAKFRRRVLTEAKKKKNVTKVAFFFFLVYLVVNRGAEYKKKRPTESVSFRVPSRILSLSLKRLRR